MYEVYFCFSGGKGIAHSMGCQRVVMDCFDEYNAFSDSHANFFNPTQQHIFPKKRETHCSFWTSFTSKQEKSQQIV